MVKVVKSQILEEMEFNFLPTAGSEPSGAFVGKATETP